MSLRLAGDEFCRLVPVPRRLRRRPRCRSVAEGARRKAEKVQQLAADDPVWESVAWAIAQLCHAIVCAAAPRAIAIGGGVVDNQPHLLERAERMLVESLNGYMQLPAAAIFARAGARQ